jgi:hypothetical protein
MVPGSVAYRHRGWLKRLWSEADRRGERELAAVLYELAFVVVDAWEKHTAGVAAATRKSVGDENELPPSFTMDTKQAAARLGHSSTTYVKRIAKSKLGGRKTADGEWRFEPEHVEKYARRRGE